MSGRDTLESYKARVRARLDGLRSIFAKASIGDFSEDVFLPEDDDEFLELYTGVQVMLEVIRNQIKDMQTLNRSLESKIKELHRLTEELKKK